MKTLYQPLLLAIGALALAGTAYGQVPSTNDTSDINANTGMGINALGGPAASNGGYFNTASGADALSYNTTGSNNTASGQGAMGNNTIGNDNTAAGYEALYFNTNGSRNTADGYGALFSNMSGSNNTASGSNALYSNTGSNNTATGSNALNQNTSGSNNTASGFNALYYTTSGNSNTAFGEYALRTNTTGSGNIAVGFEAGLELTTGSNNIDIGNGGVAGESNVIRIGTKGIQTEAFVAGIYNHTLTGNVVVVTAAGRLGVQAVSSERFKTAITPMGSNSEKLAQLKPVTFHLKTDPKGALQYGLIAEEVAKVYPELVIRDGNGRIDGVRYDELAPMLLNEAQRQQRINEAQAAEMRDLKQQVAELKALNQATQVAPRKLQAKDEFVAQR